MNDKVHSLKETYGITNLDVTTRSFAGLYINGRLLTGKEHFQCIREYQSHHFIPTKAETTILHFLEQQNGVICFIDDIQFPPYHKVDTKKVINAVLEQIPTVLAIYAYSYPNFITLLYQK